MFSYFGQWPLSLRRGVHRRRGGSSDEAIARIKQILSD